MKIAPICLLTAFERRKFILLGNSSQVRAIDNGVTCCYWSASFSNRLRALKAQFLFQMLWKELPKLYVLVNIVVLDSGYFSDYLCHWNWFLLSLFIVYLFIYIFCNSRAGNSLRAEKSHWQVQKVTLAGPKSHTRTKMPHWSVIISGIRSWIRKRIRYIYAGYDYSSMRWFQSRFRLINRHLWLHPIIYVDGSTCTFNSILV